MIFKKFIFPIIILLVGFALTMFGALLKILHYEIGPITGDYLIAIGTFVKIFALIWAAFKLFKIYREK